MKSADPDRSQARHRGRATSALLTALSRILIALLLIGSAGTSVVLAPEGDAELTEESEDERIEEATEHARLRQSKPNRSGSSSVSKRLDPPLEITPTNRPAPRVTWRLPRRAPPDDDDGPELAS